MSLMTQVAGVLKTTAKDFNVAALVRMTWLTAAQDADGVKSVSLDLGSLSPPPPSEVTLKLNISLRLLKMWKKKRLTSPAVCCWRLIYTHIYQLKLIFWNAQHIFFYSVQDNLCISISSSALCHCSAGHKPCGEKPQRQDPAWSGCVLESRAQNQNPTGSPGQVSIRRHVQPAFCNTDQVFSTGTAHLPLAPYWFRGQRGFVEEDK